MYRVNQRKHTCAAFFLDLGSLRRVFGLGIVFLFLSILNLGIDVVLFMKIFAAGRCDICQDFTLVSVQKITLCQCHILCTRGATFYVYWVSLIDYSG